MPPKYRVAETVGTPISPPVTVSLGSSETLLLVFSVLVMLALGTIFLCGVWFFLNRLQKEQDATNRIEGRLFGEDGTGSHPDKPLPGRDFTPQADLHPYDDSGR